MPKSDPDDLLAEAEEVSESDGKGTSTAEVAVKGKGRSVKQALKNAGLGGEVKNIQQKFQDLLKNPRNKISAKRIAPKTWQQADKKYDCEDVVELPPPMSLDEIVQHLRENYGGKKWNVRVFDEDGEVLDAKNIDVPGNPIINADAMEQFDVPSVEDLGLGDDDDDDGQDPQDRELVTKQKEQRILELDEQIAKKKKQIAELHGNGQHRESSEEATKKAIAEALALQQSKHDAEMKAIRDEHEKQSMERRMTDSFNAQINALKELIAKKPDDGGGVRDVLARIDNLKLEFQSNLKDTLGSYKEAVNQQISSLEKHVNTQVAAIQQSLNQISHKPEASPFKDVVPLITSSIEKSSAGYKEVIGPLMAAMTQRTEAESAPTNPVKETIELLQMTGAIPGPNSQPKDFGNRVVDFAEKMAPDVLNFIKEERHKGAELTREAVQNQLKLIAQKISNDVSQHASNTIKQIAAQRGLPTPQQQVQQVQQQQQVQQVHQEQQVQQQRQVSPNQMPNQNPVGQITAEEQARYSQRHIASAPVEEAHEEVEEEAEEEELSPEEEMAARVNDTLALLDREMVVRPKKITWTRFAWDNLPGEVLDKVIFANDDMDVYEAVKPYADEELSNKIWNRIKAKPDAKEFIVAGINQIKAWAVQIEQKKQEAAAAMQQQAQQQPPPAQA